MAKRGQPPGVFTDGRLLREARESLGLSREALCELPDLDLCVRTVQTAERGGPVSASTARNLALAVGLTFDRVVAPPPEQIHRKIREGGRAPEPPPTPWAGRPHEEQAVVDIVTRRRGQGVACITGLPGTGKTALARQVAHQVQAEFPGGVLWVNAGRRSVSDDPRVLQRELAHILGFHAVLDAIPPGDLETRDMAFLHHFWETRRRMLILDDVRTMSLIRRFIPLRGNTSAIVITGQRDVAAMFRPDVIHLTDLPDEDSRRLISAYVGDERLASDESGTRELLKLLVGVPRSLHIAGSILQREIYTTPSDYAHRIETDPKAVEETRETFGAMDSWDVRQWSQVASLEALSRLVSHEAWALFGWLGVFGDTAFPLRWAAGIGGVSEGEAARAIADLRNVYLLEELMRPRDGDSEPSFRLDEHVAGYARWRSRVNVATALQRLRSVAASEARRYMELPRNDARRIVLRDGDLWRLVLDHMTSEVVTGGDAPLEAVAERRRDGVPTNVQGPPELPVAVVAFASTTGRCRDPEVRRWLNAAFLVAISLEDRTLVAQTTALLAAGLDPGDPERDAWHNASSRAHKEEPWVPFTGLESAP
ncbi:MAG: hypothetical protein AMXMBFR64_24780 [Myxococcales bacterium]